MEKIKNIIVGFVKGKNLKKQLPPMLIGVFMMGFTLSWLYMVDWGTDTFTNMNLAISERLGLGIGTWQLILNIILFIIVIILGADNIGFGTVANMVFIGYLLQFFTWVWTKVMPEGFLDITYDENGKILSSVISEGHTAVKIIIMIVALAMFVFFAALYMDSGLGVSPCDALPFIAQSKIKKLPIKAVRIIYDLLLLLIAFIIGSRENFLVRHIVTILMAFTLGPVIEFVGKRINKWFKFDVQQ